MEKRPHQKLFAFHHHKTKSFNERQTAGGKVSGAKHKSFPKSGAIKLLVSTLFSCTACKLICFHLQSGNKSNTKKAFVILASQLCAGKFNYEKVSDFEKMFSLFSVSDKFITICEVFVSLSICICDFKRIAFVELDSKFNVVFLRSFSSKKWNNGDSKKASSSIKFYFSFKNVPILRENSISIFS